MKIIVKKTSLVIFFCLFTTLQAELKQPSQKEIQNLIFMQQNRPNFGLENPLKGFSEFVFFSMYPGSKSQSEKIDLFIKKELEKIGQIKKVELEVKNKDGEFGIDLSPFDQGASLTYEIRNLTAIDGKDTGFVRASLNLESRVSVLKTKQDCSPYLWSSNCFLKGSSGKDLEKLVMQSFTYLMQDFSESYKSANSEKPIFNLYTP
jgi:hypothetical protein